MTMVNIISVTTVTSEIVETEGREWNIYRRYSSGDWEVLMGESWEPQYFDEKLEQAYNKFKEKT